MVKDFAIHLERSRTGVQPPPLGKNWIQRFQKRHPDLALKLSTQLERQRAYAKDPKLLQDYFGKLSRLIRRHGLRAFQIFNMDEKGFLMGKAARAKVLCRRGRRNPRVTHDGSRELVTVIETICGSGVVLSPFVINKGAGHYMGWYKNLTMREKGYKFSYSVKGWTDDELALEWLMKVFEPESRAICGDLPRLLIFDGHGSHITYEFVSYCLERSILLLCLPSHSTHLLQPLDVGLFSPYQHFYGLAVDDYVRSGQDRYGIKKAVFIPFLTQARNATFTSQNILQAFTATGIWPLNPRRVLGKIAPPCPKRRNTLGVVKTPRTSREIRHQVKAAGKLVDSLVLPQQADSGITAERVKSILSTLGHQLEEEIAEKEIWQELSHKLQNVDSTLFNATDRRKLSEARVLDAEELLKLRDARLEKDRKRAEKSATVVATRPQKQRTKPSKKPALTATSAKRGSQAQAITIANTPQVFLVDSEDDNHSESELEELSDNEWNSLPQTLGDLNIQEPNSPPFSSSRLPDRPLHMTLRSRRVPHN